MNAHTRGGERGNKNIFGVVKIPKGFADSLSETAVLEKEFFLLKLTEKQKKVLDARNSFAQSES